MFSTLERLRERSGRNKPDRFEYLQKLVEEFSSTSATTEMKRQIVANLANFSYDPINNGFLRELSVLDMFLDLLAEDDPLLVKFAVAGLCNICLDPENREYVLASGGVDAVAKCLYLPDEETVLNSITTLMFLITPQSKPYITNPSIIKCMLNFLLSENRRFVNLAKIFLDDYCSKEEIELVKNNSVEFIPLPETSDVKSSTV